MNPSNDKSNDFPPDPNDEDANEDSNQEVADDDDNETQDTPIQQRPRSPRHFADEIARFRDGNRIRLPNPQPHLQQQGLVPQADFPIPSTPVPQPANNHPPQQQSASQGSGNSVEPQRLPASQEEDDPSFHDEWATTPRRDNDRSPSIRQKGSLTLMLECSGGDEGAPDDEQDEEKISPTAMAKVQGVGRRLQEASSRGQAAQDAGPTARASFARSGPTTNFPGGGQPGSDVPASSRNLPQERDWFGGGARGLFLRNYEQRRANDPLQNQPRQGPVSSFPFMHGFRQVFLRSRPRTQSDVGPDRRNLPVPVEPPLTQPDFQRSPSPATPRVWGSENDRPRRSSAPAPALSQERIRLPPIDPSHHMSVPMAEQSNPPGQGSPMQGVRSTARLPSIQDLGLPSPDPATPPTPATGSAASRTVQYQAQQHAQMQAQHLTQQRIPYQTQQETSRDSTTTNVVEPSSENVERAATAGRQGKGKGKARDGEGQERKGG